MSTAQPQSQAHAAATVADSPFETTAATVAAAASASEC